MTNIFFDIDKVKAVGHHKAMMELTDILCHRTGNVNRTFFQAEIAYFLGLVPSSMRVTIKSPERGTIPTNIYSIALATSGFGKGHSISLMEEVITPFRKEFTRSVFPAIADKSIYDLAVDIASAKGGDEDAEKEVLMADFRRQGHSPFIFDSGTGPAVKQLRYKLLLSKVGAINFQMDEIGSNLVGNSEILDVLLELYDLGKVKTKLVKNTVENQRGIDIVGETPTNALLFGTPSKLFDGAATENAFFSFLETGYARRCFFGLGIAETFSGKVNPELVYDSLVSRNKSQPLDYWAKRLASFADIAYHGKQLSLPKEVGVELIAYRLYSESVANQLPEHEVTKKAEIGHRYFKALKLAGVYAFIDNSDEVTMTNLHQAIHMAEQSGEAFQSLLKRERNFVRLAKYISESPDNLTHADLVEDLPYYPSSATPRREIMDLAMAWGVSNHTVITKNVVNGVDFFSGSKLKETDLNKLTFSFSNNFAADYVPQSRPFTDLPKLLGAPGLHWCSHSFENQHRTEENAIPGFNMLVVDVDGTIPLEDCHELLQDFTFMTSTTKRHTDEINRFRLIMPTNYILELSKSDYRDFINSFLLWLPFESDTSANQRSKKWMTHEGSKIHINQGTSFVDVLPFIPKTKQNSEYVTTIADLGNLGNLERWFHNNLEKGNRNNNLFRFAVMLYDAGMSYKEMAAKVLELNRVSASPMKTEEVKSTVLKSIASKYNQGEIE